MIKEILNKKKYPILLVFKGFEKGLLLKENTKVTYKYHNEYLKIEPDEESIILIREEDIILLTNNMGLIKKIGVYDLND